MELFQQEENRVYIVRPKGEIDLNHSPKLRSLLQSKSKSKCPALLLDFSSVSYIDSSGLGTLVEYFKESRGYGGRMALSGMSARVRSYFDFTSLTQFFSIYETAEEAIEALSSSPKS